MNNNEVKPERLFIKFEGQEHQIDANTLVQTLIHYSNLVNQINTIYTDGDRNIDIKINAIKEGSFIINISLIESFIDKLPFVRSGLQDLACIGTLITCVIAIFQLKKGKPADKKDNEEISQILFKHNIKIDTSTVINIYNNQTVRASISKSIETANEDESIEGIEISLENDLSKVNISKEQFPELIYDEFDKEQPSAKIKHIKDENAVLNIISLSFNKNKKWDFSYCGFKISINVKDDSFIDLIDNGLIRFAKGDRIIVNLEITQEFDENIQAYVNKKYRIEKFIDHIARPEQKNLFE